MKFIEVFGRMFDGQTQRPLAVSTDGSLIAAGQREEEFYPFAKGPLTVGGTQYSTEYVQSAATATDEEVERVTVNTSLPGVITELYCSLSAGLRAGNATTDLIYTWQARSVGYTGSWVNLNSPVTKTDINTTVVLEGVAGYFATINSMGRMPSGILRTPFQVRLVIQSNEASQGKGKTASTSRIVVKYIPD